MRGWKSRGPSSTTSRIRQKCTAFSRGAEGIKAGIVMNIQFGLWNFRAGPVTPIQVSRVKSILDRLPFEGQEEFRDSEMYFLRRYTPTDKETGQLFQNEAGSILC